MESTTDWVKKQNSASFDASKSIPYKCYFYLKIEHNLSLKHIGKARAQFSCGCISELLKMTPMTIVLK
jgi:hypothetical protein